MPISASLILVAILVRVSELETLISFSTAPILSLMVPSAPMVWSLAKALPPAPPVPPITVVWAWASCVTLML